MVWEEGGLRSIRTEKFGKRFHGNCRNGRNHPHKNLLVEIKQTPSEIARHLFLFFSFEEEISGQIGRIFRVLTGWHPRIRSVPYSNEWSRPWLYQIPNRIYTLFYFPFFFDQVEVTLCVCLWHRPVTSTTNTAVCLCAGAHSFGWLFLGVVLNCRLYRHSIKIIITPAEKGVPRLPGASFSHLGSAAGSVFRPRERPTLMAIFITQLS